MTLYTFLVCMSVTTILSLVSGRPTSMEQLPDDTNEMLNSMGLVDDMHEIREISDDDRPHHYRPPPSDKIPYDTYDADQDRQTLFQLVRGLRVPGVLPVWNVANKQRRQNAEQLLQRPIISSFSSEQKRAFSPSRNLYRQLRGYMCLSKVCNFKGSRGK